MNLAARGDDGSGTIDTHGAAAHHVQPEGPRALNNFSRTKTCKQLLDHRNPIIGPTSILIGQLLRYLKPTLTVGLDDANIFIADRHFDTGQVAVIPHEAMKIRSNFLEKYGHGNGLGKDIL